MGDEQLLHQRRLPFGSARGFSESVGVEGAAHPHMVEVESEAHLGTECGQLRVAGAHLLEGHAVFTTDNLLHRALGASGRATMQLEGSMHHGDLVAVLEVA